MHLAVVAQAELIPDGEANLARLELGKVEPRNTLLIETHVPPDDERLLGLRLLEALVVVGLDLDERPKDVLVLVRVLVATTEMMSAFVLKRIDGQLATHRRRIGWGSSSTPTFSRSSIVAAALSFQSSSSLLIWWKVIWRARSCSCSDGTLTSHERNERSSISGDHWVVSQTMSLELCIAAHGCLWLQKVSYGDICLGRASLCTCREARRPCRTWRG